MHDTAFCFVRLSTRPCVHAVRFSTGMGNARGSALYPSVLFVATDASLLLFCVPAIPVTPPLCIDGRDDDDGYGDDLGDDVDDDWCCL